MTETNQCVAFGTVGDRSFSDLCCDVSAVALRLPKRDSDSRILMCFRSDRYAFAVALYAAWSRGHTVALSADLSGRAITAALADPNIAALCHDTAVAGHVRVTDFFGQDESAAALVVAERALVMLEDGTEWSRSELECQVDSASAHLAAGDRVQSTVGPSTGYGLLMSVLAPLRVGGAFARSVSWTPETIGEADVLVSTPPHLRALVTTVDLETFRRVFSSLAPRGDSEQPGAVTNFYGVGGLLSPARSDRMVGSVDLDALEHELVSTGGVDDAAVIAVPDSQQVVAVVDGDVLKTDSNPLISRIIFALVPRDSDGRPNRRAMLRKFGLDDGGRPLEAELVLGLPHHAETTADSTSWRVTVRVPERYTGFDGHFDGYPVMAGAIQLQSLVLPAMALAVDAHNAASEDAVEFAGLRECRRVKFLGRIQPGDEVEIELDLALSGESCHFTIRNGETTCSAGLLRFGDPS